LARDIAPDVRAHLWQRFIRQEAIALINAPTHTGKTVLAAGLACAVAHGQPFMGRQCAQGGVYIIELEGASLVADNIRAWHEREGFEQKDNIAIDEEFVNLTNTAVVSELMHSIKHFAACQGGCKLVIIDTLSQAIPGEDENRQKVMSAALQAAQRIKREIGAAC
jgi:RecA-family ATPase